MRIGIGRHVRQVAPGETRRQEAAGDEATPPAVAELRALDPEQATQRLLAHLLARTARVLRWDARQRELVAAGFAATDFGDLGLDSLMAVELQAQLKRDLAVEVPLPHFMSGSKAIAIAELMWQLLAGDGTAAGPQGEMLASAMAGLAT